MTDNNHLITPPLELAARWWDEFERTGPDTYSVLFIATKAARWGADQELEACCEWLRCNWLSLPTETLRAARRPKPKSQAEEARQRLEYLIALIPTQGALAMADPIRAALERLRELEKQSDD